MMCAHVDGALIVGHYARGRQHVPRGALTVVGDPSRGKTLPANDRNNGSYGPTRQKHLKSCFAMALS